MLEYILTTDEMKQCDRYTIEKLGVSALELMERAAQGVAKEILNGGYDKKNVIAVCGTGNNGGDGLAVAAILKEKGVNVSIMLPSEANLTEETKFQLSRCEKLNIPKVNTLENATIIIDALFGIGLSRNIEGSIYDLINDINASDATKISIDAPSGINCDTGKVMGNAVRADTTVVISHKKIGMMFYPAKMYVGEMVIADIGISMSGIREPKIFTLNKSAIQLQTRVPWGHKGTFGKVLIIGSDKNMAGASYLAALSAFRTGAGQLRILTIEDNRQILQTIIPEAVLYTYKEDLEMFEEAQKAIGWADAYAIGCGLGMGVQQRNLVGFSSQMKKPAVIDADALNILAAHNPIRFPEGSVYTPHVGEMTRLTGKTAVEIKADPVQAAKDFAKQKGGICVLKDAVTVVSNGDFTYINSYGNAGMATSGSGDCLTGIITAFLAEGYEPFKAAYLGVIIHSLSGDCAKGCIGERSIMASDIANSITSVLRDQCHCSVAHF